MAMGTAFFHANTDGFRAFTVESARRLEALESPRPVPTRSLEFSDGRRGSLDDVTSPVLIVDFIYTRCMTFCSSLGSINARLQRELADEIGAGKVSLVSITFDPDHDGPEQLTDYRQRFSKDARGWALARPASQDVAAWLSAFGVFVVADEWGGFTHNAALHVVGPDRRLVGIYGLDEIDDAVRASRARIAGGITHDRPG